MTDRRGKVRDNTGDMQKKTDGKKEIWKHMDDYEGLGETDGSGMDSQGPAYFTVDQFSFMTGKNIFR